MPIIVSDSISQKGRKDARRHREKQKDAIKEKLPEIIANESIITQKKGKLIRIPIKSIDIPHFKPKHGTPVGVGQGKGQPGDVIHRKPGDSQPGEPGQEPGEDYLDSEADIEEIIALMLEDFGLPNLEQKSVQEIEVTLGFKIKGITRSGPWSLLDRRKTAKEGIKRFWSFLKYLETETNKDQLSCYRALKQSGGILDEALELLKNGGVTNTETEIVSFPIIANEDLRFRKIQEDIQPESRAVIIAMMDVSGSMTDLKKYYAKSILFWLVEFLRRLYKRVDVRFVTHHTTAQVVSEENFFRTSESGGTNCYSAYELANNLIETEYLPESWNIYVWHFSDGEDGNIDRTIQEIAKLIDRRINMIGYGEIQPSEEVSWASGESRLWTKFKNYFHLTESHAENEVSIISGDKELPFLGVLIEERSDILPVLKAFLKKDRWVE